MALANAKLKTSPGFFDARERERDLGLLIHQTALGDQAAFAELFEATKAGIFKLLLHILSNRSSAEEVLLDVYVQVWRHADRYDSSRGAPAAWLITIARTRAIDRLRGEKRQMKGEGLDDVTRQLRAPCPSPENHSLESERQQHLRTAVSALTPGQREVIELTYYGGMSHTEVAEQLGWPLGTVKTRSRLAIKKLREQLSAGNFDFAW